MPSTSKLQQILMGLAYAVKSGYMLLSDVSEEYQDKVKDLINGMTLKQLKNAVSSPNENIPEKVKETLNFVTNTTGPQSGFMSGAGMGNIKLPNLYNGEVGSGDIPNGTGWAEDEYEKENKKRKKREKAKKNKNPIKTFEQFILEKLNKEK